MLRSFKERNVLNGKERGAQPCIVLCVGKIPQNFSNILYWIAIKRSFALAEQCLICQTIYLSLRVWLKKDSFLQEEIQEICKRYVRQEPENTNYPWIYSTILYVQL